ncbi:MAG: hypothetical protein UGF44_02560, partial [Collinsella sp.]|nr:hypothetical protein [Collinsella sp.]
MGSLLPAGAVRATARADTQSPLWHPEPAERSCAAGEAAPNGFLISSFDTKADTKIDSKSYKASFFIAPFFDAIACFV